MKLSQIIKTIANMDINEVLAKVDKEHAKVAGNMADVPLALANVAKVTARVTENQATTFRMLAEGLHDMSSTLREPTEKWDNGATDGPDIPDLDDQRGGYGTPYYIIARDTNGGVIYYGPGDRQTVLDHLMAWEHPNADLTTAPGEDMEIKPLSHFAHGLKPAKKGVRK